MSDFVGCRKCSGIIIAAPKGVAYKDFRTNYLRPVCPTPVSPILSFCMPRGLLAMHKQSPACQERGMLGIADSDILTSKRLIA